MTDESYVPPTGARRFDAFIPLLLLALSLAIVFIWQLTNLSSQRSIFQSTITRQEELVKQSKTVQGTLEKLVIDLLELARSGDTDAQAVVQKYNIQQQAPPAAAK